VNGIDISTDKPPTRLWVINRERIRAGKGALEIAPTSWACFSEGKPCGVTARGRYYGLGSCFTEARSAMAVGRAIVQEESDLEDARYAAIKARLVAAHHCVLTAFRNLTEETAA
jgi:hypothetical protein